MPKTKTTNLKKKQPAKKRAISRKTTKAKWTDQQLSVRRLLEEELHGLIHYLRSIHYIAVILIISSLATLLYALSVLFTNGHQAIVGFLVVIVTSIAVSIASAWVLKPWVLPRFLLPIDLNNLDLDQLKSLFNHPDEYLQLLKTHTQVLTEQFLIPKLTRLRNAIVLFVFGMSIAILLAIVLP